MPRADTAIRHVGVFGRRLSGKTTLLRAVLRSYFAAEGRRALVLDPNLEPWGEFAWVTADRDRMMAKLWASWGCNVVVEEAGSTIRRDAEVTELFTRSGHRCHRVFVAGHTSSSLLPVMREQLTELYLFRQSQREADGWAELFTNDEIRQSTGLDYDAREFLHVRLGHPVRRGVLVFDKST